MAPVAASNMNSKRILNDVANTNGDLFPIKKKRRTYISMKKQMDKLRYAEKKELIPLLKKILQKFPNTIGPVFESYPNMLARYRASATMTEKKKMVTIELKSIAAETEGKDDTDYLIELICRAIDTETSICLIGSVLDDFVPKVYPKKFHTGHPMLSRCFMCKSTFSTLKKCHDLKVCDGCSRSTYTKTELKDTFGLQPKDAGNIPCKKIEGRSYCNNTYYLFKFNDAISACSKKYGCLGNFVREKMKYQHRDIFDEEE